VNVLVLLAGLDRKLGSISHEFLSSTAAVSFLAHWSWLTGLSWVGAISSGLSSSWECSLGFIGSLDGSSSGGIGLGFGQEILHGVLSLLVSNTLACSNSFRDLGLSSSDCGGVVGNSFGIGSNLAVNNGLGVKGNLCKCSFEILFLLCSGDSLFCHIHDSFEISKVQVCSSLCFILDSLQIDLLLLQILSNNNGITQWSKGGVEFCESSSASGLVCLSLGKLSRCSA